MTWKSLIEAVNDGSMRVDVAIGDELLGSLFRLALGLSVQRLLLVVVAVVTGAFLGVLERPLLDLPHAIPARSGQVDRHRQQLLQAHLNKAQLAT